MYHSWLVAISPTKDSPKVYLYKLWHKIKELKKNTFKIAV